MTSFDTPIPISEIESILAWVDQYKLSRCTKKINRDFADAVLLAEILNVHYPKMLEMHNYPSRNSHALKLNNWMTLNRKVLKKLKLNLCYTTMESLANATPGYIERLLIMVRDKITRDEDAQRVKDDPLSSGGSYHEALTDEGDVILIPLKSRVNGVLETVQQKVISYNTYLSVKQELKDAKETADVLRQKVEHLDSLLKLKEERIEELQRQLERKTTRRKEIEALLPTAESTISTKANDNQTLNKPSLKDDIQLNIKLTKSIEKPIKPTNSSEKLVKTTYSNEKLVKSTSSTEKLARLSSSNDKLTKSTDSLELSKTINSQINLPLVERKPSIQNIPVDTYKFCENSRTVSYVSDTKASEKPSKVSFNVSSEISKIPCKISKQSFDSASVEIKPVIEITKIPNVSSKESIYSDPDPSDGTDEVKTNIRNNIYYTSDEDLKEANIVESSYVLICKTDSKYGENISKKSSMKDLSDNLEKLPLHNNPQIEEPSVQKIKVLPAKLSINNTNATNDNEVKGLKPNLLHVTGSKKFILDNKASTPKNRDTPNLIYVNEAAKSFHVNDTSLIVPAETETAVYSAAELLPEPPKVISKKSFPVLRNPENNQKETTDKELERVNSEVFEEAESITDQSQVEDFEDSEDLDDDTDGLTNTADSITRDGNDVSKIADASKEIENAASLVDNRISMGSMRQKNDSKLSF